MGATGNFSTRFSSFSFVTFTSTANLKLRALQVCAPDVVVESNAVVGSAVAPPMPRFLIGSAALRLVHCPLDPVQVLVVGPVQGGPGAGSVPTGTIGGGGGHGGKGVPLFLCNFSYSTSFHVHVPLFFTGGDDFFRQGGGGQQYDNGEHPTAAGSAGGGDGGPGGGVLFMDTISLTLEGDALLSAAGGNGE